MFSGWPLHCWLWCGVAQPTASQAACREKMTISLVQDKMQWLATGCMDGSALPIRRADDRIRSGKLHLKELAGFSIQTSNRLRLSSVEKTGIFPTIHMGRLFEIVVNLSLIVVLTTQPAFAYARKSCGTGISETTCSGCGCCQIARETEHCACCRSEKVEQQAEQSACCDQRSPELRQEKEKGQPNVPQPGQDVPPKPAAVSNPRNSADAANAAPGELDYVLVLATHHGIRTSSQEMDFLHADEDVVLDRACRCLSGPPRPNAPAPVRAPSIELLPTVSCPLNCRGIVESSAQSLLNSSGTAFLNAAYPHFYQVSLCVWRL